MKLEALRSFAVRRSLFAPVSLARAVERLGFVQADPIRAPARAQDLILRPRVKGYRAGDLERRYHQLDVEEDTFVNYGFLSRRTHALIHPRAPSGGWNGTKRRRGEAIVDFVRARGTVHPREVDAQFAHGKVVNAWGGSSSASTQLLEELHYRGLLRVVRREGGVRIYELQAQEPLARGDEAERLDALVDIVVEKYAPLPASSLVNLVGRLRWAAPRLAAGRKAALARAKQRLAHARVDGTDWYWPANESPEPAEGNDEVRLLAPFDPVVWDRPRFERFFGWAYRFEAYTPVKKRKLGYYALPLLWREQVVGWGNLSLEAEELSADFGFVDGRPPREPVFRRELEAELERMRRFLDGR